MEEVHVFAQGRRWRFASAAAPLIEQLATGQPLSMADLSSQELDPANGSYFCSRTSH